MIQAKQINGLFLVDLSVSTEITLVMPATLTVFAFRARQKIAMGSIALSMVGGAWVANDLAYWNIVLAKNGAGIGAKSMQTVGAGGTGNIAQSGTAELFPPGFFTDPVAGDVLMLQFFPIGGPANLDVAEVSFDLSPS